MATALEALRTELVRAEDELGRIDAIAGDGDHGRGMVRGATFAARAAAEAAGRGWGARGVLDQAGDAWAEYAGGTSGVLWGAGLRAMGRVLGNEGTPDPGTVVAAAEAYLEAIVGLGKAEPGDKTLVDAVTPFVATLAEGVRDGRPLAEAHRGAVDAAGAAAEATAGLLPRKGRARPLAERSLGTPDPGAVSFVMCARRAGEVLEGEVR